MLQESNDLMNKGLQLSGIVETTLRNNLTKLQTTMNDLKWDITVANETLRNMFNAMEEFDESKERVIDFEIDVYSHCTSLCVDHKIMELMERIEEIVESITEINMDAMALEDKIRTGLEHRVDGVYNGSSVSAIDVTLQGKTFMPGLNT